jgi:hypothetical protein
MNVKLAKKIRRENKIIPILFLSGKTFEEELYNPVRQPRRKETLSSLIEKNLLQHLYDVLPASKRVTHVPVYNPQQMRTCTAEELLILITFFEESIHLREYILN